MDRTIIDLPTRWFGIVTQDWHLDVRGRSAGAGVTGDGQVVYGNKPRWTCSLQTRVFRRPYHVHAWRAVMHRVRGRVNVLRVQVNDPFRPYAGAMGISAADLALICEGRIPHNDDALFDDGSGYTQSPTMPLLADAAAGATTLLVDASAVADVVEGGHWFTLDDWLYLAVAIEGTGTSAQLTIEPPLRAVAAAGDELNFDAWALMTLEDDLQGRLPINGPRHGSSSLSLFEWTNR